MMQRPYLKDRLIEERPEGYVVIVPVDADPIVPLACPVCDHVLRSREDDVAYRELACCDRCARLWARPRREAWKDGWRPTVEQLAASELERPPLSFNGG